MDIIRTDIINTIICMSIEEIGHGRSIIMVSVNGSAEINARSIGLELPDRADTLREDVLLEAPDPILPDSLIDHEPRKKEDPKPLGFDHTKFSRRKRRR